MRRKTGLFLILTFVLFVPSIIYSAVVTQTTAEQVAMNCYTERNEKATSDFKIIESFVEQENANNIYYIFNFDKTGFVIVAADDIAVPILGYVFKHNYTTENHPPQFDAMLASFREQILYARENDLVPPQETVDKWNRLKVTKDMFVPENVRAVGPLLSTTWNQGQYYNESCPADGASTANNGYVWAGCTATATAQVMKYHAHPVTGEGLHSYTDATYGLQSVNFGATTYNWVSMPNNVTAVNPFVHTLLYHVGVGAEMQYGPTGSGAWIGDFVPPTVPASALSALQDYFKYDLTSYYDQKVYYTIPVWDAMLKVELDNNRPLVYEGYSGTTGSGHAFVLDGYTGGSNDYYHFNWGWGGAFDGYFYLNNLNPGGADYTNDQAALFGVEPRKWRPLPDVSIDVSQLSYTGVDLDLYYEGPTLISYSVVTDLTGQEFALTINGNNQLIFTASPSVTSNVNIDIKIRATYTGGTVDDTFNFIITGASTDYDWGDAPDPTYPTLSTSTGAYHKIVASVQLGSTIDSEPDGQPNSTATGDDIDGNNDDDGVVFTYPLIPGSNATVTVTASVQGILDAWLDFDANGFWVDPLDQIFIGQVLAIGPNVLTFPVPVSSTIGTTYARFRFNTFGPIGMTGLANNGEVEDYEVEIGGESSLKWEQLPDLSPTGMDVDATWQPNDPDNILLLADDFLCSETGNITDIHIWGSWMYDQIPFLEDPAAVQIKFSIHSDIPDPDGEGPEYSMPGDMLWMSIWIPDPDDVEMVYEGPEDWYNPALPMWLNDNHFSCYKYNYILDPPDYFFQEGTIDEPIVYWLDVQALPTDENTECRFGWKTSLEHWNDDAVWVVAEEPYTGIWNELIYPPGHEFNPQGVDHVSIDLAFQITTEGGGPTEEYDFGDAPEGANALAYTDGTTGSFPTCVTIGPAGYIQHGFGDNWARFGPTVDVETDGNAGSCPVCFPPYDVDECFNDGDAGLLFPDSYTIDATNTVVSCSGLPGTPLGIICNNATWGTEIDIDVTNNMSVDGFVNVLVDWNQDGLWQNDPLTLCAGVVIPEHILVDFAIPMGFTGPLSTLMPSPFVIGPNSGNVWVRFSITETAVLTSDWDGSGVFEDGETEDYLLYVEGEPEELDFGDAPDPLYPTLLASNGACHVLDGVTFLGSQIDAEPDGQQSANADGDDLDGNDDEDGVAFTSSNIPGLNSTVDVVASVLGVLNVWYDFNNDGDWADAGEQVFADVALVSGINNLSFSIPASATLGMTMARFRFDTRGGLSFDGSAQNGEVEDYEVLIEEELDFGDAPDPLYPTLLASDGARHILDGATYLGLGVDTDPDGQPDAVATGDDNDGNDDEDGIIFNQIMTGSPAQVTVTTSTSGYLSGWMDFDGNGSWDAAEQIFYDVYIHFAGTICLNYYVPANAVTGLTFARFRFDTGGGLLITGQADDGEVEDYQVEIIEDPDLKWSQLPCEYLPGLHCHDYIDPSNDITLADDWLCNGGLVTDIHWWGNYDQGQVNSGINYFHLSIHADDPNGTCLPLDPELWGVDVPLAFVYETDTGLLDSEGNIIYSYDFVLSSPFEQIEGTNYWLDISVHSNDPANYAVWRWQETSRSVAPILCPAAEKSQSIPWQWIDWLTPQPTRYSDMAFEITSCPPSTPVNFTITKVGTTMRLDWDPDPCSLYYNVYSSTNPYAAFPTGWTLETPTAISNNYWLDGPPLPGAPKKFYRVTAKN